MATRRERVILELEDKFTADMARAAAATALVKRELRGLSGTAVQTSRDTDRISQSVKKAGDEFEQTGAKARRGAADIDRYSGRLGLLLRVAGALGPLIVPIGAAAIPAIAGLTAGLGAAAGAAGVAVLALQGVGDALKAMDEYQLEPTQANLEKMQETLDKLGPAGAQFVRYLDSLDPVVRDLQNTARAGLFPGVEQGIENMLGMLPQVRRIIFEIASGLGEIAADTGAGSAGSGFRAFFNYLETDAKPTMIAFAQATGNVVEGVANMIVAFAPLSRDFTGGLVSATEAFANWTAGLSDSDGFQAFVDYIRETGPQVAQLVGQIALALAGITEAAAPVGQALLPALTALAKVVETIANSDLGTPLFAGIAAMSALRLATQAWGKIAATSAAGFVAGQGKVAASLIASTSAQDRARLSVTQLAAAEKARTQAAIAGAGRLSAVLGGLALAASGTDVGANNTASLALMGSIAGPPGTAIGATVGALLDVQQSAARAESALRNFNDAVDSGDPEQFAAALEQVNAQLELQTRNTVLGQGFLGDFAGGIINTIAPASNLDKIVGKITGSTNDLRDASQQAAPPVREYASTVEYVGAQADQSASEIAGLSRAMQENRSQALSAFDAVTQYGDALAAAREAAAKGKRGIDENTEAGRENRNALSRLAAAWNNQSDAVRNNNAKFREARRAFVETATAMGVPIEKARALARRLLEIPNQKVIDLQVRDRASGPLRNVQTQIAALHDKTVTISVVRQLSGLAHAADAMDAHYGGAGADGMTVPGPRHPYGDKVLIFAAPGEEVITNRHGEADYLRATGRLPGFANGGTIPGTGIGSASFLGPGGGHVNQLFGANAPFLSAAELANRILNLSIRQIGNLSRDMDGLSKRGLQKFGKALDIAADSVKKHRDELISQRDQLAGTVKSGLTSDIWAQRESTLPSYLAASQMPMAADPLAALRGDVKNAKRFQALERSLAKRGLKGAAFQEAAANGGLEGLEILNDYSGKELRQYSNLIKQRDAFTTSAGNFAGNQAYGREIQKSNAELRAIRHEMGQLSAYVKRHEKRRKKESDEHADRVAAGVGRQITSVTSRVGQKNGRR